MENLQGGMLSLEHRYRVDKRYDRQGLVTRYFAEQLPFENPVWIGVYDALADAGAGREAFDRVKRAAHRAHRIDGEAVLRVLDYGELEGGIPFAVEQRVDGPSLAEYLEEHGTLPPQRTADLVERVGRALESAHASDLAHGTLRPEWIFLEGGDPNRAGVGHFQVGPALGELRRLDGVVLEPTLVRPYPPESFELESPPPDERSSGEGEETGAPETRRPADEFSVEADVYALGAVAYECLVGFHPYFDDAETDNGEGVARLREGDVRPLEDFGVAPEISEAVGRAIATDPAERWATPGAFAEALGDAARPSAARSGERDPDTGPEDIAPEAEEAASSVPGIEREPGVPGREPEEREPRKPGGPAAGLVTLALVLFVGSNVAWLVSALQPDEAKPAEPGKQGVRLGSQPSGAEVYPAGEESPIGSTPMQVDSDLLEDGPVELRFQKEGTTPIDLTVRRDGDHPETVVHLPQSGDGGDE